MAWPGARAPEISSTGKHTRSKWSQAGLAFQEMTRSLMSKPWKTNTQSQTCPAPALTEKKNQKTLLLWQTHWVLVAIQILTHTHTLWAKNQKISCKTHNILIWTFLQCCIIASINVKSSWASQKATVSHSAPQSPSFLGGWDGAVYSQPPPPVTRKAGEPQHPTHNENRRNGSMKLQLYKTFWQY